MTITVGSYGTGTNVSTNFVLNVPSGVSNGDLLIATLCNYYHGDIISTPSGWTDISATQPTNPSPVSKVFSKLASSEPASYNFPVNNGDANTTSGVMQAFSGSSVLVDVIGAWGATDTNVPLSIPAITVAHGGYLIAVGFGRGVSGTGEMGTPATFSSLLDITNTGGGTTMGVKLCGKANSSTGTTGVIAQTVGVHYYTGCLIQIYESAGAATSIFLGQTGMDGLSSSGKFFRNPLG
jgi:hypothetical protein